MKNYLTLLIVLAHQVIFCQDKHDFQWVFGHQPNRIADKFGGTLLSFDQNFISKQYFEIFCRLEEYNSFCDLNGNLLLYTNGCAIYGKDHRIIENGDGINPGDTYDYYCKNKDWLFYPKNNQELFIPGFSEDTVYLFHLGSKKNPAIPNLYRTTIVINNGKPTVVEKNRNYGTYAVFPGLQAIRHGNGRDWWIIMKHAYTNIFNKFRLGPSGLSDLITQDIGPLWGGPSSIVQAAFSPDGKYYAIVSLYNGIHLYHFDRCSGDLFRYLPLNYPIEDQKFYPMGVAFSADSKFLYLSSNFSIYQYDLSARVIVNSYTLIDTIDGYVPPGSFPLSFYQLQLAPDNKIYCSTTNETNVFHVIHNPERKGKACNLKQHDFYLPTTYVQNMPSFPHYRLYDMEGSACDTLGINKTVLARFRYDQDSANYLKFDFVDLSFYQPTKWFWEFGDAASSMNTSTEQYPKHEFLHTGIYIVCLTASNVHGSNKICKEVQIGPVSVKDIQPKIQLSTRVILAPNPCGDILQILVKDYYPKQMSIILINSLGQQVFRQRIFAGNNILNMDQLTKGLYHVRIIESEKIVLTESIILH